MSCSISKLKSHLLLTCKNFVFQFYVEKNFLLQEIVGGREGGDGEVPTPITPFLYGPGYTWLIISHFQWDLLQTIATAFLSSSLVGSFTHCKYSLTSGFQIILQTWYPLIYCLYALSSPNTNLWTHIGVDRTILDKFQVQSLSFLKSCLYDQNVRNLEKMDVVKKQP